MPAVLIVQSGDQYDRALHEASKTHVKGTDLTIEVLSIVDEQEFQSDVKSRVRPGKQLDSLGGGKATRQRRTKK